MATKFTPSRDYLRKFPEPLWELIDLEDFKPLTVIEGERDGYAFSIIEMRHRAYGLLADNGATSVSTFFVIAHQQQLKQPCITQGPAEFQVSADCDYVYLVRSSKQIRPTEWEGILKQAIQIAKGLVESNTQAGDSVSTAKTYSPVGAGVFLRLLFGLPWLIFAIVSLVCGLGAVFGLINLGATRWESIKLGWQFVLLSIFLFLGAAYEYYRIKKRW